MRNIGRSSSPLAPFVAALTLCGCASLEGYPADPENTSNTLSTLSKYFDGTAADIASYNATNDDPTRTRLRNIIVLSRIRAYDIEFSKFKRQLMGFGNSVSVGTDLIGLALGGLTATTGSAATKSALGAASVGVLGANTAINKDLYYQKTIPALISQMEANRGKAELAIVQGLRNSDAKYSLLAAYNDLDAYKDAGSIADAIATITTSAGNDKKSTDTAIVAVRTRADFTQLPKKEVIQEAFSKLTPASTYLELAKAMQGHLQSRPANIQELVKTLDPDDSRLDPSLAENSTKAKHVLFAWIGEEDMSAENFKEWSDAMAAVAAASPPSPAIAPVAPAARAPAPAPAQKP